MFVCVKCIHGLEVRKAYAVGFKHIEEIANRSITRTVAHEYNRLAPRKIEEEARYPARSHVGVAIVSAGKYQGRRLKSDSFVGETHGRTFVKARLSLAPFAPTIVLEANG